MYQVWSKSIEGCIVSNNIRYQIIFCASVYCQIFINCGVLIFTDFMVHLNDENKNPTKYNVPIDSCMYHLKRNLWHVMQHLPSKYLYKYKRISNYFISLDFLCLFSLEFVHEKITQTYSVDSFSNGIVVLWKYFHSLALIFVVSTKCMDPCIVLNRIWKPVDFQGHISKIKVTGSNF
jgi:hypothetical protein